MKRNVTTRAALLLAPLFSLALLFAGAGSAARADDEKPGTDLERHIDEMRQKARRLAAAGEEEMAAQLAKRIALLEKVQALRRQSNDFERRGKRLRENGHEEQAAEAMEESGRLWKRSEEMLRKIKEEHAREGGMHPDMHDGGMHHPDRDADASRVDRVEQVTRARVEAERARALVALRLAEAREAQEREGAGVHVDRLEVRTHVVRAEQVRKAIALLREAKLPGLADLVERETREITQPPKPIEPFVVAIAPRGGDVEALRREVAEMRKQMQEIREILQRLRDDR